MSDAQPAEAPSEAPKAEATEVPDGSGKAKVPNEEAKPTETAAQLEESSKEPLIPEEGTAPGVENKSTSEAPEKPTEPPAEKPAEEQDKKVEAAEEASVKMLAANLEPSTNGNVAEETKEPTAEASPKENTQAPVTGEKRKADEVADINGDASNKKPNAETPAEPAQINGAAPRKVGRPKKDKKAPVPVGRTARRTRSQGAPDA